ncbi:hypothetical protein GWI34_41040, partial [Actinomadura sp. DSM 109109]|nr:hypothetical protein [Actinomadura lepetitiana]
LFRILTNLNIDRGRKVQRTPDLQPLEESDYFLYNKLEETSSDGPPAERRVVERLSQNDAVTALADLQHDFRDGVLLVDLADVTYSDAAQILDMPIGTVMSRLHRGRRMLKGALATSAADES